MQAIQKQFIVDDMNRRIAVQIDYKTFLKIEELLENYALYQLMEEYDDNESLDLEQAKNYYQTLGKAE
jgi:RelB antitoxin of RelBE toxin-antitoxin system